MKFPSIQSVFKGVVRAFLRFPLAILFAITATAFSIVSVHLSLGRGDADLRIWNVVAAAYLGMLLSIALTVLAEKRQFRLAVVAALQGGVLLLAVAYFFSLPAHYTSQVLIRFILLALALHWLIACIGFIGRQRPAGHEQGISPQDNGFWVYNKQLFLRILTGFLYNGVLYLGLVIALSAIEHLFHVDIDEKTYIDLWLVIAGVFNTVFFLAGFPDRYDSPRQIDEYPKGLKIFTQFVLLPILTIYLLILYAYGIRIAVTAAWPYGWVSYMVLCFSVAGILAILLVWPLRDEDDNKWISGYSGFFYFALFPLIVLLGFAICKRVAAYGITEQRYFVLLLAAWLLLTALYFLVSKKKTIRLIPLSLCVAAFLSAFGPWGAESVALHSQRSRLKAMLEKYQLLTDGKITGKSVHVALSDRQEISDITEYIVSMHGYRALQPLFNKDLDSVVQKAPGSPYLGKDDRYITKVVLKEMEVPFANSYVTEEDLVENFYADIQREANDAIETKGYDYIIPNIYFSLDVHQPGIDSSRYQLGKHQLLVVMDTAANRMHLFPDRDSSLLVDLSAIVDEIPPHNEQQTVHMPGDKMSVATANTQWGSSLVITRCDGDVRGNKKRLRSLSGYLLMKKK
jgi:hypothetical protein